MKKLSAFYFTGTGNTRYVAVRLCKKLSSVYASNAYDISSEADFSSAIKSADCVMLAFPVYGSSPPVPMRRFVYKYASQLCGKEVIIIATQYLFSGDGAASLGRTVKKLGGKVKFAEHFDMPNNLSDCKFFAIRNGAENSGKLEKAERRMDNFVRRIKEDRPFRRGFNIFSHATGYFCQRMLWRKSENIKKDCLRTDPKKCIGCGICAKQCPVGNLQVSGGVARAKDNCVYCYRCVNICPRKAITLFGSSAPEVQYKGIKDKNN